MTRDLGNSQFTAANGNSLNPPHPGARHAFHAQPSRPEHRRHPVRTTILILLFALFVLAALWVATIAVQARRALSQAQTAQSSLQAFAPTAKNAMASGDMKQIASLSQNPDLAQADESLASLDATVNSPLWAPLTLFPGYGQDVTLARGLASAGHQLTSQVLPGFLKGAGTLATGRLTTNGVVNTRLLTKLDTTLSPASTRLSAITATAQSLPKGSLPPLESARIKMVSGLSTINSSTEKGIQALTLLSRLLASPTQQTWVITGATPAEIRSSAGLTGSIGQMKVGQGRLTIGSFTPNTSFVKSEGHVIWSDEAENIFSVVKNGRNKHVYAMDTRDVGIDPDFEGMAENLLTIWQHSPAGRNSNPQGVIVVDPLFVQQLIAATGSLTAPDGTVLTGTNAADYLNNGLYIKHPTDAAYQDALFAGIVTATASRLIGNLNGKVLFTLMRNMDGLITGRHIQAWSSNPATQKLVNSLGLTRGPQKIETQPTLGLYVDSYNSSKMDFYNQRTLSVHQTAGPTQEGVAGQRSYTVTLKIANTLTPQVEAGLPAYVLAGHGLRDGLREFLLAYAPKGGTVSAIKPPTTFTPFTWNGKKLLRTYYLIGPQQSLSYTFNVTTSPQATRGLAVDQSPSCH